MGSEHPDPDSSNRDRLRGLNETSPRGPQGVDPWRSEPAPKPPVSDPSPPPAPVHTGLPSGLAPVTAPSPGLRRPRNGLGIAALVLGLIGVIPFPLTGWFSILAIIFGAVGAKRASRGEATNRTMALWGMWLGIVGATLQALLYFGLGLAGNL